MTDILFDKDGNLVGTDESSTQHQNDIIVQQKGWSKFYPQLGVGISEFVGSEGSLDLINAIQVEFSRDGMDVENINITNEKIKINASY